MTTRTAGSLIYAVGDIHGCYDLLKSLLGHIAEDRTARARGRRPILVFLGDYIDRGLEPAKVLEALVWLQRRSDLEVHLLKGNHEDALLTFIEEPETARLWLQHGGAPTLAAYGVLPPGTEGDADAFIAARDKLMESMPAAHYRLLRGLDLMIAIGDYAFVHAGIRPGKSLKRQAEADLLWIRHDFIDVAGPHEKVIVHGHTWFGDQPALLPHRIGVDTGAYHTGVLTAVMLDGEERAVLQAASEP